MTPAPDRTLRLQLAYDAFGRLVLTDPDGQTHVGLVPIRSFPFSAPGEWIAFCDADGHEILSVADIRQLPAETRALLEADLARREFIPAIRRIHHVSSGAEPTDWHVETDRGQTRFQLTSEDHIRRLGTKTAIVVDSHGVRYQIPDLTALDPQSRRILRRYL
jgi:hypothetical protein